VRDPEQALAAARRAAAEQPRGEEAPPWSVEGSVASARRLAEWAIIEPDEAEVRSTRRTGRPITAVKLLLVRMVRQYVGQVTAQQSRFNAHVAAHVMRLEERVAELEEAARRERPGSDDDARRERPGSGDDAPPPSA
jgi:hypothetical protein